MNPMRTLYAVGTCALAATLLAGAPRTSWFEARTTGAQTLTLRGDAEFGTVLSTDEPGPFVLTLGATSSRGAVVFTIRNGLRPEPGIYDLADSLGVVQGLVVTGSPTRPSGAFHARAGTLTITRSSPDFISGRFRIDAVGFEAAGPTDEDRQLAVRGAFTASPAR
jgi:hypothetical protein